MCDEAPMSHKFLLEGLDRTLRDLMDSKEPFGGKVLVLVGDFRQLPTVLRRASKAQIIAASFKKSYLWRRFKMLRLTENMRIRNNGNDPKLLEFDQWLEKLGDGKLPTLDEDNSLVQLPRELCTAINEDQVHVSRNDAVSFTFADIQAKSSSRDWLEFVASRAVLAPKNQHVDDINKICLDMLHGEESIIPSADSTVNPDSATHFPVEHINTLETAGIPPHKLILKKNAVVMLLRNLNINNGLCNGTRLIVDEVINDRLLKATIANGEGKGRTVLIPKIVMQPADETAFGFEWQRLQFPVRVAFAMTVHKSQGQTLDKVVVWLEDPVFGHGQLYVAGSRVGNPDNIRFFLKVKEGQVDFSTNNIVYEELLQ